MAPRVVRAAGGVVVRRGPDGPEVLLVHRPRYDDWSLPKGKVDPGEHLTQTARRELLEETGLRCTIGEEVAVVDYVDDRGRPKVVHFFAADAGDDAIDEVAAGFVPNDEVDEIRWCRVADAISLATWPSDRGVILVGAVAAVGGDERAP